MTCENEDLHSISREGFKNAFWSHQIKMREKLGSLDAAIRAHSSRSNPDMERMRLLASVYQHRFGGLLAAEVAEEIERGLHQLRPEEQGGQNG